MVQTWMLAPQATVLRHFIWLLNLVIFGFTFTLTFDTYHSDGDYPVFTRWKNVTFQLVRAIYIKYLFHILCNYHFYYGQISTNMFQKCKAYFHQIICLKLVKVMRMLSKCSLILGHILTAGIIIRRHHFILRLEKANILIRLHDPI